MGCVAEALWPAGSFIETNLPSLVEKGPDRTVAASGLVLSRSRRLRRVCTMVRSGGARGLSRKRHSCPPSDGLDAVGRLSDPVAESEVPHEGKSVDGDRMQRRRGWGARP